ncbi:hypothetical protein EXIGLDRAFT_706585 [Exidia glandulosa HHB12029]|uniref:Uncharacterized protein n=1 Tax=Exidia glandulosa HHB12029 TaxID=1314781 RepID=A0A165PMI8_EXIGL|nr:hypothetical protein EXIGLDRAFT_706585 [Exidia glandulosa HHB12029]
MPLPSWLLVCPDCPFGLVSPPILCEGTVVPEDKGRWFEICIGKNDSVTGACTYFNWRNDLLDAVRTEQRQRLETEASASALRGSTDRTLIAVWWGVHGGPPEIIPLTHQGALFHPKSHKLACDIMSLDKKHCKLYHPSLHCWTNFDLNSPAVDVAQSRVVHFRAPHVSLAMPMAGYQLPPINQPTVIPQNPAIINTQSATSATPSRPPVAVPPQLPAPRPLQTQASKKRSIPPNVATQPPPDKRMRRLPSPSSSVQSSPVRGSQVLPIELSSSEEEDDFYPIPTAVLRAPVRAVKVEDVSVSLEPLRLASASPSKRSTCQGWPHTSYAEMAKGWELFEVKVKEPGATNAKAFVASFPPFKFNSSTFYKHHNPWKSATEELKAEFRRDRLSTWSFNIAVWFSGFKLLTYPTVARLCPRVDHGTATPNQGLIWNLGVVLSRPDKFKGSSKIKTVADGKAAILALGPEKAAIDWDAWVDKKPYLYSEVAVHVRHLVATGKLFRTLVKGRNSLQVADPVPPSNGDGTPSDIATTALPASRESTLSPPPRSSEERREEAKGDSPRPGQQKSLPREGPPSRAPSPQPLLALVPVLHQEDDPPLSPPPVKNAKTVSARSPNSPIPDDPRCCTIAMLALTHSVPEKDGVQLGIYLVHLGTSEVIDGRFQFRVDLLLAAAGAQAQKVIQANMQLVNDIPEIGVRTPHQEGVIPAGSALTVARLLENATRQITVESLSVQALNAADTIEVLWDLTGAEPGAESRKRPSPLQDKLRTYWERGFCFTALHLSITPDKKRPRPRLESPPGSPPPDQSGSSPIVVARTGLPSNAPVAKKQKLSCTREQRFRRSRRWLAKFVGHRIRLAIIDPKRVPNKGVALTQLKDEVKFVYNLTHPPHVVLKGRGFTANSISMRMVACLFSRRQLWVEQSCRAYVLQKLYGPGGPREQAGITEDMENENLLLGVKGWLERLMDVDRKYTEVYTARYKKKPEAFLPQRRDISREGHDTDSDSDTDWDWDKAAPRAGQLHAHVDWTYGQTKATKKGAKGLKVPIDGDPSDRSDPSGDEYDN